MIIRRLTKEDFDLYSNMDTGIEDDYIKRVFMRIIENDHVYGAFLDDKLAAVAGWTIFEGKYAVLGRLRTDRGFQGRGIATELLRYVIELLRKKKEITWIGLATQQDNKPARKVAEKIGMGPIATFYSLTEKNDTNRLIKDVEYTSEVITSPKQILSILSKDDQKTLNMFPYECYYPLPFNPEELSEDYLADHRLYEWNDKYILVNHDEKGESYLHVKYFWDDFFEQPHLLDFILGLARKEKRKVWLDLSPANMLKHREEHLLFDTDSPWMMYGSI